MNWKSEVDDLRLVLNEVIQYLPFTKREIAKRMDIGLNTMNRFLTGDKIPTRLVLLKIREFIDNLGEENKLFLEEKH